MVWIVCGVFCRLEVSLSCFWSSDVCGKFRSVDDIRSILRIHFLHLCVLFSVSEYWFSLGHFLNFRSCVVCVFVILKFWFYVCSVLLFEF